jgi:RHS repeat-associated protein
MTYTTSDDSWLSTNAAGDETGYWEYDAYGNLATGTPTTQFGYSGQYTDVTSGLVDDRARSYEPQTGIFTTRDPAFAVTNSAYTYANGDPIGNSDPSGYWCRASAVSHKTPYGWGWFSVGARFWGIHVWLSCTEEIIVGLSQWFTGPSGGMGWGFSWCYWQYHCEINVSSFNGWGHGWVTPFVEAYGKGGSVGIIEVGGLGLKFY